MEYTFNEITSEELVDYYQKANVFNISKDQLLKEKIIQNKFDNEFGSSVENVEIYIVNNEDGKTIIKNIKDIIDVSVTFTEVTSSGSGYYDMGKIMYLLLEKDIKFDGFLIVTRTLSSYIMDKNNYSDYAYYYNICSVGAYNLLNNISGLNGFIAKKKIRLTDDYINDIKHALYQEYSEGRMSELRYKDFINKINMYSKK